MLLPPESTTRALVRQPPAASDWVHCHQTLADGSKSFAAAARLLPAPLRDPVAALYAFCRVSDDAVDEADDVPAALRDLEQRLERIYAAQASENPIDRTVGYTIDRYGIPKRLLLALLEGYAWDAQGRLYRTLAELESYCARVASTVGVMMSMLFGIREPQTLARAADLGIGMQLTNICRDVGEDARRGRLYLPLDWLDEAGVNSTALLEQPQFSVALGATIQRLLQVADGYYERANVGIAELPRRTRVAIRGAALIYRDIGRIIAGNGYDSVSQRAYTGRARKLWLLLRALGALFWRRRPNTLAAASASVFLLSGMEDPS